ncbi:24953_t:CDS:2 [Gigaspora rosea]|nr:24953_t:CDS:2 [Gigaspora rosea]
MPNYNFLSIVILLQIIRSIEDIRFMDSSDTLNDSVVYENKDIPDPTSPYIPKSFDCSRQATFYDCTQDFFRSSQLTIDSDEEFEDKMDTDDDYDYDSLSDFSDIKDNDFYIDENVKVLEMVQDFDLLISPAITNYQMSRTTWITCSTMIF